MDPRNTNESFISLERAAFRLGVPAAWLRTEAEAERVPYLRAGRRLLFNCAAVERELLARAARKGDTDAQ